jgi:hypothetical protein
MRHRFFADAKVEPEELGDDGAAADRFFAALQARRVAPPPLPLPAGANAAANAAVAPPARFGGATFLARAAEHFEARRCAGLIGSGAVAGDASDVAREFADEGAAGENEAALSFE